jgi:hypothetical protein
LECLQLWLGVGFTGDTLATTDSRQFLKTRIVADCNA